MLKKVLVVMSNSNSHCIESKNGELIMHNTDDHLLVVNEKIEGKIETKAVFQEWIYWAEF